MRGLLLTLEGIEGSGKTTQAQGLVLALRSRGYPVLATREPGGVPLAEKIREIVLSSESGPIQPATELLLFIAARAEHVAGAVRPALEAGQVVVCDRFIDATLAYQGGGRGVADDLLARLQELSTGGLLPDRTYLLDVDVETGRRRAGRRDGSRLDRIEQEGAPFFESVRRRYLSLAEANPERIVRLRGNESKESLARRILDDALILIQSRGIHPSSR